MRIKVKFNNIGKKLTKVEWKMFTLKMLDASFEKMTESPSRLYFV
jgi:hypothetical protein